VKVMLVFVILLYTFIIIFELIPMIKKRRKKDLWVYIIGLAISFILAVLISFNVKLPSPNKMIEDIILMLKGD